MITADFVRQRFIEAAKTEQFLVVNRIRPKDGSVFWPYIVRVSGETQIAEDCAEAISRKPPPVP